MSSASGRKSGGAKKIGRDKVKCAAYRAAGKREKNKKRRAEKLLKHLAKCKAKRIKT